MTVFDLYLAQGEAGLAVGGAIVGWEGHAGIDAALARWLPEIKGRRGFALRKTHLRTWLSGSLARPFLCGPLAGLKGWREAKALAQASASSATGLPEPCAVTLEDWPHPDAALAIASESSLVDQIARGARETGLRLDSIRPWWVLAANMAPPGVGADTQMVVAADADAVVLIGGTDDRWKQADTYVPLPDQRSLEMLIGRSQISGGVDRKHWIVATLSCKAGETHWPPIVLRNLDGLEL